MSTTENTTPVKDPYAGARAAHPIVCHILTHVHRIMASQKANPAAMQKWAVRVMANHGLGGDCNRGVRAVLLAATGFESEEGGAK